MRFRSSLRAGKSLILIESASVECPGEPQEDTGEADESPSKLAINISNWLNKRGFAQASLAKYLDRSKSHFTDVLNHGPSSMAAKHGKEAWIKIKESKSDADAKKAFPGNMPKSKSALRLRRLRQLLKYPKRMQWHRQNARQLKWRYGRRFYWMKSSPHAMEDQSLCH